MKKKNSGVILMAYKSVLGLKGVYPFFSVVRPQQKRPMYAKDLLTKVK